MSNPLSARDAVCRLLATAWEPQDAPAPETIPWPEVLRFVGPTNLAGSLHVIATRLALALPSEVGPVLEAAYYRAIAANLRCLEQLSQVGAALSSVGAPVMLLKGASLLDTLYDNVALRALGDIDLLVPLASVPACRTALLALGYRPEEIEARPGTQVQYRAEETFLPPHALQAAVEIHWHLLDVPYYMDKLPMDWFWRHSQTRVIAGQPFQVLDGLANLIYLPAHLALHHQYEQLHSLLDLALLIVGSHESLDWTEIMTTARSFELLSALRGTLDRLAACWPSLPLAEPRRRLASVAPSRLDARLHILLTREAPSTSLSVYTTLVSLPSTKARLRYLVDNLLPQPSYMIKRYQVRAGWTLPYWYLYRFLAGLLRFLVVLPRTVWRERNTH